MKILVATGPSGGHISPALGFLEALRDKNKDIETLLILPRINIVSQIQPLEYRVNYISFSPVKLKLDLKFFIGTLRFFKSLFESIFIFSEFRPDIVIGFGSSASIPLVSLAWLFRIKNLIHEQNVVPGRANIFLARFTDKIAVSFSKTKDYFKADQKRIVLTGNPIRKELMQIDKVEALFFFGFRDDKFTILVMGGSQGSSSINMGFLKAISTLPDRSKLQIIHLAGIKDYDLLRAQYKDSNINLKLFSFFKNMEYAYSACDLVISRAGAASIAEIIHFRIPAIIIPYPYAYKHQLSNAAALESNGCAMVIQDKELETDTLSEVMVDLINNPDRIKKMHSCYDNIPRLNANDLLVNEVLSLN